MISNRVVDSFQVRFSQCANDPEEEGEELRHGLKRQSLRGWVYKSKTLLWRMSPAGPPTST